MFKVFKRNVTVALNLQAFQALLEFLDEGTKFTCESTPFGLLVTINEDVLETVQHTILEMGKIGPDDRELLEALERR